MVVMCAGRDNTLSTARRGLGGRQHAGRRADDLALSIICAPSIIRPAAIWLTGIGAQPGRCCGPATHPG